jgi:hypothetical protein
MRNSLRIERTRQRSLRNPLRARRIRWTSMRNASPGFEPVSARCATRCGLVEPVGHPRPIRCRSSPDGSVSRSTRRHGPNPAAFRGQRIDSGRTRQRFGVNASTFAPLGQRVDVFPLRALPCGRASCTSGQRRQRFRRRARVSALTTMRTLGALAANVSACRSWQSCQLSAAVLPRAGAALPGRASPLARKHATLTCVPPGVSPTRLEGPGVVEVVYHGGCDVLSRRSGAPRREPRPGRGGRRWSPWGASRRSRRSRGEVLA